MIRKDTCTAVFTAALLTIAKTWKEPKSPSTKKWLKKMWCVCVCVFVYNGSITPPLKMNELMPFEATWMNLESVTLPEVRQRRRNIM